MPSPGPTEPRWLLPVLLWLPRTALGHQLTGTPCGGARDVRGMCSQLQWTQLSSARLRDTKQFHSFSPTPAPLLEFLPSAELSGGWKSRERAVGVASEFQHGILAGPLACTVFCVEGHHCLPVHLSGERAREQYSYSERSIALLPFLMLTSPNWGLAAALRWAGQCGLGP